MAIEPYVACLISNCVIIQGDDIDSDESDDYPKDDNQDLNQEKSDISVPDSQISTPDDCKLIDK